MGDVNPQPFRQKKPQDVNLPFAEGVRALEHFFEESNLIAQREIALGPAANRAVEHMREGLEWVRETS